MCTQSLFPKKISARSASRRMRQETLYPLLGHWPLGSGILPITFPLPPHPAIPIRQSDCQSLWIPFSPVRFILLLWARLHGTRLSGAWLG